MRLRHLAALTVILAAAAGCASATASSRPSADVPARQAAGCSRSHDFGPVLLPPERFERRTGAATTTFAALSTSKGRPLEECGIEATLQKLVALRCGDGSNPFDSDLGAAHASRLGSFGPGGQCGSIIDAYEVRCPERKYEVFADSYVCPQQ